MDSSGSTESSAVVGGSGLGVCLHPSGVAGFWQGNHDIQWETPELQHLMGAVILKLHSKGKTMEGKLFKKDCVLNGSGVKSSVLVS